MTTQPNDAAVAQETVDRRQFIKMSAALMTASASGATLATTPAGSEITRWSALDLSKAIHSRQVSCKEVMSAYLAQIDRLNPKVNAIVSRQPPEDLLRQAEQRDLQLAQGQSMGWMHGFPQAPKDLANTAGITTTQGSPILRHNVPRSTPSSSSGFAAPARF